MLNDNEAEVLEEEEMIDAGEEADFAADGTTVDSTEFQLVQADKHLHDVKFTTKPTTFFKDAMRRFVKDKSSVTGGIILGILFVLAVVLPIPGVIPYDVQKVHAYETNLPPKLFNAGSGFWDGTRTLKNQTYPYDADGNYIGEYPDDSAIIKIKNPHSGYGENQSSDGQGGFVRITSQVTSEPENRYMYSASYTYKLSENNYTMNVSLGTTENQDVPTYGVLYTDGSKFIRLSQSTDYGEITTEKLDYDAGQTVYQHATVSFDLNELVNNCDKITNKNTLKGRFGLYFLSSDTAEKAFYVHDVTLLSDNDDEAEILEEMSFKDANAVMGEPSKIENQPNPAYWAVRSDDPAKPVDVITNRCDIVYDMYEVRYGLRADMDIPQSDFDEWIKKGYIQFDYEHPALGDLEVSDAGQDDVYVKSVEKVTRNTINVDGENVTSYTMNCTVTMWKYLGYKSMPRHLFGTEANGRDLLKYAFSGLRTSLLLGVIVSAINILIGIIWGSISGYFGGTTDIVMERITDILSGMPWIILMTVLTLKLGTTFFVFGLALCLTGWIGTESVTRSQFYRYRDREYVLAAKTLGAKSGRLIFRHILPNAIGTIVTSSVLMIPSVIFSEATISYLGLGLKGLASLGVILSDTQNYLQTFPYQLAVPAVIISLLMICFNLFGNGLRDAFNPSLKGSE